MSQLFFQLHNLLLKIVYFRHISLPLLGERSLDNSWWLLEHEIVNLRFEVINWQFRHALSKLLVHLFYLCIWSVGSHFVL